MVGFRLGLVVAVLSCAEPTANTQPPAPPVALETLAAGNSFSFSPVDGSLRVRIASVRGDGAEKIHEFMRRVFDHADAVRATRLVLDVREISGSDAFLLVPLLKGIVARDHLRTRGGLVVIVGPDSFSPTQNAATLLGRYANPVFAR